MLLRGIVTDVVLPTREQQPYTPILDLIEPLPEVRDRGLDPRQVTLIVTLIAIGLIQGLSPGAIVLGYFTICFAATAVHEVGHFLAGCSVRLRLEYLMIGPLCLKRASSGGWKLQLRQLSGGLIQMSIDRVYRVRRRLLVYYSGGPIASLLTGLVALFSCRIEKIGGNPVLGIPLAGYAIWSLLMGIQSLRPLQVSSYSSDGMLLRTFLGSYEGTQQQIAAHALQMLKRRGVDRSLWNRRWMKRASTPTQILRTTYFEDWLGYEQAADSATAAECLERCLAGLATLSPLDREEVLDDLLLEAAAFTAWKTGDAEKAAIWVERAVHPENARVLTRAKAEVALHCVNGRFDAALAEWEKGLEYIHCFPAGDRTDVTTLQWFQLKEALEQRRSENANLKHRYSLAIQAMQPDGTPSV